MGLLRVFISVIVICLPFRQITAQDVTAVNGMVASAHPLATQAGVEILRGGGNAVDAAVATALALAVVEPNASGLGGGGFMVVRTLDNPDGIVIDYREIAPRAASADIYYSSDPFKSITGSGYLSVGVPGVPAGLETALKKYGTLNLSDVVQPALRYAHDGFVVSDKFADMITLKYELISAYPPTAAIYLQEGLPPSSGDTLRNPDLVRTLEEFATDGGEVFYHGQIARLIETSMQKDGGIFTQQDLANYRPLIKKPVTGTYRGYQILSVAPPAAGGTHLIELLNIMEGYDLKKMGHHSADYLHHLAEAMKICLADKDAYMADPDFEQVPVKQLTAKRYAQDLREHISPDSSAFNYQPDTKLLNESGNTTHLSVVDKQGNIVALTQSINFWFGSGITVEGTGIILNNELADFASEPDQANSIGPWKRPASNMGPTILLKNGKPFLTIGTPGGTRIIGALAQIIINIVDFGMSIDQAIEAPRIHTADGRLHIEDRIPEEVIRALETKGHHIQKHDAFDNYFGGAQGILIDPENGHMTGGADSRRDGTAMGY